MTRKVIITNKNFKESSGYTHTEWKKEDIEYHCPLYGALFEADGELYDIGIAAIFEWTTNGPYGAVLYSIPTDKWNNSIVQQLVDRAKAGEIVPDVELELEIVEPF